jgi:hypothetical protein
MTGPQFREPRQPERQPMPQGGGDPADADWRALVVVFGLSGSAAVCLALAAWTGWLG